MKRRYKIALAIVGVLVAAGMSLHLPIKSPQIVISRQTTFIDGPLNPDGTVNYAAAVDARCSEGVTPQNNAANLLLKAFGRSCFMKPLEQSVPEQEILSRLGLTVDDIQSPGNFKPWEDRKKTAPATASAPTTGSRAGKRGNPDPGISEVLVSLQEGIIHPDLRGWLADNEQALRMVQQASTLPKLYFPIVSSDNPPLFITSFNVCISPFRDAPDALVCRAALRIHDGDIDGAWSDLLTMHRFARLVGQLPTLLANILAFLIDDMASEQGTAFVTRGPMPPEKALAILRQLEALPPPGDIVYTTDVYERFGVLESIMFLSRGGNTTRLGYGRMRTAGLDYDLMLRFCNASYDEHVAALRLGQFAGRKEAHAAYQRQREQLTKDIRSLKYRSVLYALGGWGTRQFASKEIARVICMIGDHFSIISRTEEDSTRLEIEKLALALACFHARQGHWADRLEELTPELVGTIPKDVFSDKALVYKADQNGYLLYSVGMNERDDGGSSDDISAQVKHSSSPRDP